MLKFRILKVEPLSVLSFTESQERVFSMLKRRLADVHTGRSKSH